MPGETILENIQKFDKDVNGVDLQEFSDGVKNLTEKDYQELGKEITEKDTAILTLLDKALDVAKKEYEEGKIVDVKIINLLKLSGKIEIPKIEDSEYLENIKNILSGDIQNIKNILETNMKTLDLININPDILKDIDMDESGIFIQWIDNGQEKKNYILPLQNNKNIQDNRDYLLNNVRSIIIKYLSIFSKYNRQIHLSLNKMDQNLDYEENVVKCYKDIYAKKDAFKNGTLDLTKYGSKYGKEQLGKSIKYIISKLVQDKELSSAEDLYRSRDKKFQGNITQKPPIFTYIENNFQKKNTIYDSIYESLYFGFLEYEFKNLQDPKTKYFTKEIVVDGKLIDATGKQINRLLINDTDYGKKLRKQSKIYYENKEKEQIDIKNKKVINGFSNTLSQLQQNIKNCENECNYYSNGGIFQKNSPEYNRRLAEQEMANKNYDQAIKEYAIQGTKSFVTMILLLKNQKQGLDPKLQDRVAKLHGGKKEISPIGNGQITLDFGEYDANKTIEENTNIIVRDSFREKTSDTLAQMLDDIKNNPSKFIVDVVAIIGAGLAATAVTVGTEGAGIVAAGATFTTVSNLIKGIGYGTIEVIDGGSFSNGFGTGIGYLQKNEKGIYESKNMNTFVTEKLFELGSGIILMGPIGRIGGMVEGYALNTISQTVGIGEKILAKGIGLMVEAGVFTGFGTVYDPLQTSTMTGQTYTDSLNEAMQPDKLLTGFIYNVGFIGAIKVGGFLSNPLSKKIMDKVTMGKYDKLIGDFEIKGKEFENLIKKEGIQIKENQTGDKIMFYDKNNLEITDFTKYQDIIRIQQEMLLIQQGVISLSSKLGEFNQKPKVKEFNEFCKNNDLVSEFLPQDVIINKRIELFKKKGNLVEVQKREKIKEEYIRYKGEYDNEVVNFAANKIENTSEEVKPENRIEEVKRMAELQNKSYDELTLNDWEDMGGLNVQIAYAEKNKLWERDNIGVRNQTQNMTNIKDMPTEIFVKLFEGIRSNLENKAIIAELNRIRTLEKKPFDQLTFHELQDIGIIGYIQKNKLWERKELQIGIDIIGKNEFLDLTIKDLERLVENIKEYKNSGKGKIEKTTPVVTKESIVDKTEKNQNMLNKEVKTEEGINKHERFNLRKMNPDTQKILPQLKEKFPKLEQLFDAMIIKDYESPIVQQQLQELSLLPKNLIDKIRQKTIVFFISNEGVVVWPQNVELKGVIPRGRENVGMTRDDVAGLASHYGEVYAGKGVHGSSSLILHELAHQIDMTGVVNTKELQQIYQKIKSDKQLDPYFLQEGEAGLQEFFAETFAEFYKISKNEFKQKYSGEYYEFLKQKIGASGEERVSLKKEQQKISPEIVQINARLNIKERVEVAKKLLKIEITPKQERAILESHVIGADREGVGVYNYIQSEIRQKIEILEKAGFTPEQRRILLENGICGEMNTDISTYIAKISNLDSIINDDISNLSYNKSNKPIQNFDTEGYSLEWFKNNPDLLKQYYREKMLPGMVETDVIKQKIMQDIVDQIGGDIKNAPLKGVNAKTGDIDPNRAVEKIIIEYFGDVNKLLDISRGTLVYDNIGQVYDAFNALLQHPDVVSVFVKDNFQRKTGYRDINLAITIHTGKTFELQLNTKALLESKDDGLLISNEYISTKKEEIENNPKNNFYGDVITKVYNKESIFNVSDEEINMRINDRLDKKAKNNNKKYEYVELPDVLSNISGHKLYELTRELENVLDVQKNAYKTIPEWLQGCTYEQVYSYNQKINNCSNLLYDYAHNMSK